MLSNLLVAFKAVAPVFILIGVGMVVRHFGIISEEENRHLNKMVFLVFFGPLMVHNICSANLKEALDFRLIVYAVTGVLISFALIVVFVLRIEKDNKKRGALIQAIYRSNFVVLGIPIVSNIFGTEDLSETSMMIAFIVPLYNILAVIVLEVFRGGRVSGKHLIAQIGKNPLIIGAVIGTIISVSGITLPGTIDGIITEMGQVATPMALVILGISFQFSQVKECGKNLWIAVLGRLVVVPAVVLGLAAMLGFRGVQFVTLLAIFAAPTAVSSYTMAVSMDSDGVLAGNAVIMTSLLSSVTMFLWIFIFKTLGMF